MATPVAMRKVMIAMLTRELTKDMDDEDHKEERK
jgi:hypothetical protein